VMGGLPKDPLRSKAQAVDLDHNSLYAERIRELRTNLRFTVLPDGSGSPRCIAVTSPGKGDGRTTTAIDLAAALAESGRSVLLVDGDLREPTLADRVSSDDAVRDAAKLRGLTTVLVGEHDLRDVIAEVPIGGHVISLLPAGPSSPRPGELWATDRAAALLDHLRKGFDYVVIDTPPLGAYTDGAVVGALADGAILLARIAGTTARSLRRAVETLASAHVTLLGTVVTFEPVSRVSARAHGKQRSRNGSDNHIADQTDGSAGAVRSSNHGASNGPAADLPSVRVGAHGELSKSGFPDEGQ
jgi:capsular exopolysaccharide synthesis family protein